MTLSNALDSFQTIFHTDETPEIFFAPGRINLIGEHTDYNGGHVFPASLSYGTYAYARKRDDRQIRLYSMNFPDSGIISVQLDDLAYKKADDWANFPKGMVLAIQKAGHIIETGFDVLYEGNIPNGAGLSSSASIEMATGVMLENMFRLKLSRMDMIRMGQQVENDYMGIKSGIMDQFAIGMGKKDKAILIDCQTLDYHYATLDLRNHAIIIMNTNKQRTLEASGYNERRRQCEAAVRDLQQTLPIQFLGDLTPEQFDAHQSLIQHPINRMRAKHAVDENARTINAHALLEQGDLNGFGELMNASHHSLKHLYDVTGPELDTLVEVAGNQTGVIGVRMTGAGFGGCAIAIVEKNHTETFQYEVGKAYKKAIGYDATFYTASIEAGAKKIERD